jgi:hypothetical protein
MGCVDISLAGISGLAEEWEYWPAQRDTQFMACRSGSIGKGG